MENEKDIFEHGTNIDPSMNVCVFTGTLNNEEITLTTSVPTRNESGIEDAWESLCQQNNEYRFTLINVVVSEWGPTAIDCEFISMYFANADYRYLIERPKHEEDLESTFVEAKKTLVKLAEAHSELEEQLDEINKDPEKVIEVLIDVLKELSDTSINRTIILLALAQKGLKGEVLSRAYYFSEIACGRKLLKSYHLVFSNNYFCVGNDGQIEEYGRFTEEAYFKAARKMMTPEKVGKAVFEDFASLSHEVVSLREVEKEAPYFVICQPTAMFLDGLPNDFYTEKYDYLFHEIAKKENLLGALISSVNCPRFAFFLGLASFIPGVGFLTAVPALFFGLYGFIQLRHKDIHNGLRNAVFGTIVGAAFSIYLMILIFFKLKGT